MASKPTKHTKGGRVKGPRLDENSISYYKRVADSLKEGFQTADEKDLFLDNVFTQLENEAIQVSCCATTSQTVENLVAQATVPQIRTLFTTYGQNWQRVSCDRCASHVLQKVISVLPKFILSTAKGSSLESNSKTDQEVLLELFQELCRFLKENLSDVISHTYASHVMRGVLQVLSGAPVGESVIRSRMSRTRNKEGELTVSDKFTSFKPPDQFTKKLRGIAKAIFRLESLSVLLTDVNANPVIQTLLLVLGKVDLDLCQKYIRKVLKMSRITQQNEADSQKLPPMVQDSVGSFLVEQILVLATPEVFGELYTVIFKGRLLQFAIHPSANFVLQKLISSCKDRQCYAEIFEELCPCLEDILALNRLGVVVCMAEACHRLGCKQDKFQSVLMEAFHCNEPAERQSKIVPLIATFSTYEIFYSLDKDETEPKEMVTRAPDKTDGKKIYPLLSDVHYQGSLILQHLLKFSNPKLVVTSLMELKPVELRTVACHPCGSHVIDAFFQSQGVGEKGRDGLINRMKGLYVDLACNKNGSRTLDNIWSNANIKQKSVIAEELGRHEDRVRGDKFGYFIHRNFAIRHFMYRRSDWISAQGSNTKKRKLFKDIIGGESSPKKSKSSAVVEVDTEDSDQEETNTLRLQESDTEEHPVISAMFSDKSSCHRQEIMETTKDCSRSESSKNGKSKPHKKKKKHKTKDEKRQGKIDSQFEVYKIKEKSRYKQEEEVKPKRKGKKKK